MYTDYPTVYESSINQNTIYYIILGCLILVILVFTLISVGKVYKKTNHSFISGIIPIYNIFVLLEIVNLPKWYFILLLIPGINIIYIFIIFFALSKFFRKSKLFGLGLLFLPIIFFPILAFNKSEYMGINLIAMKKDKSEVSNVPIIDNNLNNSPVINEEKDIASQKIDISIGGGVYQKDYTSNLLQVDKVQTIENKDLLAVDKRKPLTNIEGAFIKHVEEEVPKKIEEEPKQISISFPNQVDRVEKEVKIPEVKPIEDKVLFKSESFNNTDDSSFFITCSRCGARLKKDSKVCFLCGKQID